MKLDVLFIAICLAPNNEILQWTETKQIWNVFLQFADLLYRQGFVVQANDLYYKLAESCPSFTYAKEATYKLSQTF